MHMAIHIYHPSKSCKGFACSFWYSSQAQSVFATIIRQAGWDTKTQSGTFKDSLNDATKFVNIKLSEIEVCAILDCIDNNRPLNTFHNVGEAPKSISFAPWIVSTEPNNANSAKKQIGFSFTVTINPKDAEKKNSFYIGLQYSEARLVKEFLTSCLQHHFLAKESVVETSANNSKA